MRARQLAAVLAALVTASCGGSGGATKPVDPPATPVVTMILMDCGADTTMLPGADRFCTVEAVWSDGRKTIETGNANWSATGPVTVVPGKVTAMMSPGEATVVVTWNGKTASVKLVVKKKDTFTWAELPPLSEAGRQLVETWNLSSERRVTRINDTVVKVWSQPGINPEDLRIAGQFWSGYIKSLRFEFVTDSASAHTVVVWEPRLDTLKSMAGGPLFVEGGVIRSGVVSVATHHKGVRSMSGQEGRVKLYAHELGHVLGINGHPPGLHVMSYEEGIVLTLDELMGKVYNWLYHPDVPAGIKIR